MKRCTYCGREHSDNAVMCSVDGTALAGDGPPLPSEPDEPFVTVQPLSPGTAGIVLTDRRLRIIELLLVCTVAFGSGIFASVYFLAGGTLPDQGSIRWLDGSVHKIAALALLWYVLFRRSKSLSDLGFDWKWKDIGWSIALRLGASLAFIVVGDLMLRAVYDLDLPFANYHTAIDRLMQLLFGRGVFVSTLVYMCINPFFEELIVRAYVMTEVRQLTNSATMAVIVSTLLQTSYHFYQGVPMALAHGAEFLVFSLYYAKTRRITPIILAHLYSDVVPTMFYMFGH